MSPRHPLDGHTLPAGRRPNLLALGAAKAGTTWLAGVLGAHPDIFLPPQKELNALHYLDLADRLDEYQAYFAGGERLAVRCDFSVRYLNSAQAPAAAARLTPDARLLVVLRDPLDQAQSHYWHLRRQNFHQAEPIDPAPDLFEALQRFPELLLEPALYGKHLARWLDLFPRERLLIIDYRDLRADPTATLDRICDFLGVARFDFAPALGQVSGADARGGVQPRGGVAGWLFPKLYAAVTRGPYLWLKKSLGVRRAEHLKRALRLRQVSEGVFFKPGYPQLSDADRRRLHDYFARDAEQLAALTGFDISSWRPQ